jgi:hypothetical protein
VKHAKSARVAKHAARSSSKSGKKCVTIILNIVVLVKESMKKSLLLVEGTALLFAGCSKITNKLNRMMGSATPTPVATVAPVATVTPAASTMPKATVAPKATATPKPVMKK